MRKREIVKGGIVVGALIGEITATVSLNTCRSEGYVPMLEFVLASYDIMAGAFALAMGGIWLTDKVADMIECDKYQPIDE